MRQAWAQQRRDGLQVVLHAVWISRIVASLVKQLALTTTDLGDVPAQEDRARRPSSVIGSERTERHTVEDSSSVRHGARHHHERHRLVDGSLLLDELGGHLDEGLADERAEDAEPVEAREGVGARVEHLALRVEADQAVADAAGAPRRGPAAESG